MDRFNKATLGALRPEIQAALDAIAEKHGIKLQLGNIGFAADGSSFKAPVEGRVEALADAKEHAQFLEMARLYGLDPEKVAKTPQGEVRLIGYNPRKRSKAWLIQVGEKKGYVADDKYVEFYFKADAAPALVETAAPARSATA